MKHIKKTIVTLCALCAAVFAQTSRDYYLQADPLFRSGNFAEAYELLKKVKNNEIDKASWEEVHFRLGECAYRTGDWARAVEYLHTFADNCDAKKYGDVQFRGQALDFLAGAFAGMPNGVTAAADFFKKKPGKPYEAQVVYSIGAKHHERNKWDAAIAALDRAIKVYPTNKNAPEATIMLIESYIGKDAGKKANDERDRFIKDYAAGGKWHAANSANAELLKRIEAESRRFLGESAVYYQKEAEKTNNRALYNNALKRFEEYIKKYPEDKTMVMEYTYIMADIHTTLGDCEKAAHNYHLVSLEDVSKLGGEVSFNQEDAAYNSVAALIICRNNEMTKNKLTEAAMYSRESTKKFIERGMDFYKRFPKNENVPDILLAIGNFHYTGRNLEEAKKVLKIVTDKYPKSEAAEGAKQLLGGM